MICPLIPFVTENIYLKLKPWTNSSAESVHFLSYPTESEFISDPVLEAKFDVIERIITLIREARGDLKLNQKRPVFEVKIGCASDKEWEIIQDVLYYIYTECNVMNIRRCDFGFYVKTRAEPNYASIATYLKEHNLISHIKKVTNFITGMDIRQIIQFQTTKEIIFEIDKMINVIKLDSTHIRISYDLITPEIGIRQSGGILVKIDATYNEEIEKTHYIRLISNAIQMHRKQTMLKPWNIIKVYYHTDSEKINLFISSHKSEFISKNIIELERMNDGSTGLDLDLVQRMSTEHEILDEKIILKNIVCE